MLACYAEVFEFKRSDTFLTGSSLSHGGGFKMSFAALASGARVDVAEGRLGDQILPLLRKTRPTLIAMLPSALFALVRDHGATRGDFSSVRACESGGDKVSGELEQEFTKLTGLEIREGYGMTENGVATCNPTSGLNKPGSVGKTAPSFTLSLRDEGGAEVPTGREGRLWFKSPCTTVGYWNNPEATKAATKDGWFDSGDILRADEDGYLWFFGRKKQIIVHDASNISPQEVEDALLEHDAVESAGVIGIHNLLHGENVRAYITLNPDAKRPTDQELIEFARARIGSKAPEEIVVLDEMPLNPTGKVDRAALKRMAADQAGAQVIE
jgi:acyl-coenzyme A synthetase/AMP-(fatty) acid ligase